MPHALKILYEDNHLLAVFKPAGLATMGVSADAPSLWKLAKEYLKRKYDKPGNVYLGVVSRLDGPTSGAVLFARTSKAAARLTEQFRSHKVEKIYWALVEGIVEPASGTLENHVALDDANRRMRIVGSASPKARQAKLAYCRLKIVNKTLSLLEVELHTGRKHQIRLQLSEAGHPIVGDRKYGGNRKFPEGIALHARSLTVKHPVKDENVKIVASLPKAWETFGIKMTKHE
jgi:23S rRNA pseudouridine1911/1915/1917 synthase